MVSCHHRSIETLESTLARRQFSCFLAPAAAILLSSCGRSAGRVPPLSELTHITCRAPTRSLFLGGKNVVPCEAGASLAIDPPLQGKWQRYSYDNTILAARCASAHVSIEAWTWQPSVRLSPEILQLKCDGKILADYARVASERRIRTAD